MFDIDLTEKFELLNNNYIRCTVQNPVSTVNDDGDTVTDIENISIELTYKDVFSIMLSKTSRVGSNFDYLIEYTKLYLRLREFIKALTLYEKSLEEEDYDSLKRKKKNNITKPMFSINSDYEKTILLDLTDQVIIFPKDESLDNIVRGTIMLLLSNNGDLFGI